MLEAWAAEAFFVAHEIEEHRASLSDSSEPLTDEQRAKLGVVLDRAHHMTGALEMTQAMDAVIVFRLEVEYGPSISQSKAFYFLGTLILLLRSHIGDRWFLYVPSDAASLFMNPLVDWGDVPVRFESACEEIMNSAKCLALDQPTASVFHMMRVLEKGLRALASSLSIPLASQDVSTWGTMLTEIKAAWGAKAATLAKNTPATKSEEEYYGELLSDFRYFKEAWRDRVMHSDRTYCPNEARAVFDRVRSFMIHLAKRFHE